MQCCKTRVGQVIQAGIQEIDGVYGGQNCCRWFITDIARFGRTRFLS